MSCFYLAISQIASVDGNDVLLQNGWSEMLRGLERDLGTALTGFPVYSKNYSITYNYFVYNDRCLLFQDYTDRYD